MVNLFKELGDPRPAGTGRVRKNRVIRWSTARRDRLGDLKIQDKTTRKASPKTLMRLSQSRIYRVRFQFGLAYRSLLVVNDSLIELALRTFDVLLDGDGLAVFGERHRSVGGGSVRAESVAGELINRVAVVSDLGHLLAAGHHRIGLAIGFAIKSLVDGCAVGGGAANGVLHGQVIRPGGLRRDGFFLRRRTVELGFRGVELPGAGPGIAGLRESQGARQHES